jgi:hypothetical protein
MNYKKIYEDICKRAKDELSIRKNKKKLGEYYEGHHIVPKCLGGTGWATQYDHLNIALLTAREHFLCHWLLHEIYPKNYKLAKAFSMMCSVKDKNQVRYIPSSRIVAYARKISRQANSEYMKNIFWTDEMRSHMSKNHTGDKNYMYKKTHTEDAINKIKEKITEKEKIKRKNRILGDKNPAKRVEVQIKMKYAALNRKRVNCPYCDKEGPINQMRQWHFENCKNKKK